jgi:hypothetical protein
MPSTCLDRGASHVGCMKVAPGYVKRLYKLILISKASSRTRYLETLIIIRTIGFR